MAPALAFPDYDGEFIVYSDACKTGLGFALHQMQADIEKPIAFGGRVTTPAEKNYSISELECLGLFEALRHFRPYIHGRPVKVMTDHKALQFIMTKRDTTSSRLRAWMHLMQPFMPQIEYIPGEKIPHVDALSRQHEEDCSEPEHLLAEAINSIVDWESRIREAQGSDPWTSKIAQEIAMGGRAAIAKGVFEVHDEIVYLNQSSNLKLAVPEMLRTEVIRDNHDSPLAGHGGVDKTFKRIAQDFYWVKMYQDIEEYVASCLSCAKNSYQPAKLAARGDVHVTNAALPSFSCMNMDILGPFPQTAKGNRFIIVFTDIATRWVEAFASPNHTAEVLVDVFTKGILCRHGCPTEVRSDQGPEFMSEVASTFMKAMKIDHVTSAPYSPWSNGAVERVNGTLCRIMSHMAQRSEKEWDDLLAYTLAAYRSAPHSVIKVSPFEMVYGRQFTFPDRVHLKNTLQDMQRKGLVSQALDDLQQNLTNAAATAIQAEDKARQSDKSPKAGRGVTFEIGDEVMLGVQRNSQTELPNKLTERFKGPWTVISKSGSSLVTLVCQQTQRVTTQHIRWLKLFQKRKRQVPDSEEEEEGESAKRERKEKLPDQLHRDRSTPVGRPTESHETEQRSKRRVIAIPDEQDGVVRHAKAKEYVEFEKILAHRKAASGETEYLVHGWSYDGELTTWLPRNRLVAKTSRETPKAVLRQYEDSMR